MSLSYDNQAQGVMASSMASKAAHCTQKTCMLFVQLWYMYIQLGLLKILRGVAVELA